MQPVVSIIIPAFNRANLVGETLESVRRQTFADWEAVVVDDGSTDGTKEAVARRAASEPRIRILSRERQPKGAAACRNIGLAAARGEFVIFLDSDDLIEPGCLQRRTAAMLENPAVDVAVFQGVIFKNIPGDTDIVWNDLDVEPDLCRFLRGDSVWQTTGPVWRKSSLQALGGFDEQLACWQDMEMHIRAMLAGLNYLKRFDLPPDYFYRRHGGASISQQGIVSRDAVASILKICAKTADKLAASGDAGEKAALRFMFARLVFHALENRCLDLAGQGIELAARSHLIDFPTKIIWRTARLCYKARALGIRGFARLGNSLMRPYQPVLSLGLHKLAKKSGADTRG